MAVSTTKLAVLGALGAITIVLGSCALTLSSIVNQKKILLSTIMRQNSSEHNTTITDNDTGKPKNKWKNSISSSPSPEGSNMSSVVMPPFEPERDLRYHRMFAPDPTSPQAAADAHLYRSIQHFGDFFPLGDGGPNLYSEYGIDLSVGDKRLSEQDTFYGMDSDWLVSSWLSFVSWISPPNDHYRSKHSSKPIYMRIITFINKTLFPLSGIQSSSSKKSRRGTTSSSSNNYDPEQSLFHLEKSANLGNSHAQHLLAHLLSSGVFLPSSSKHYNIPADFASSPPLALVLYHYAAISGHVESQLALAYRHYNSYKRISNYGIKGATCESSLAYFEEAAHKIVDELERSPKRGKVKPAEDHHRLAEIHFSGGSGNMINVATHNRPDELEEALEYYRIRASSSSSNIKNSANSAPDLHAALTLASFYHYGMRGVEQDLSEALRYYEIAADAGSLEAAGWAGKFHLLGIGYEGDEIGSSTRINNPALDKDFYEFRGNTNLAYQYLQMGAPGGLEGCTTPDPEDPERSLLTKCDSEALNGLGLIYLIGLPHLPEPIKPNRTLAREYFKLAKERGSTDALFHLGMMKLGWWLPPRQKGKRKNAKTGKRKNKKNISDSGSNGSNSGKKNGERVESEGYNSNDNSEGSEGGYQSRQNNNDNGDEVDSDSSSGQNVDLNFISTAAQAAAAKFSVASNSQEPPHVDITGDPNKGPVTVVIRDERGKEHVFILPANDEGSSSAITNGVDYSGAISDLVDASNKGHIQAMHRLGMIYSHGIKRSDSRGSNTASPLEWDPEYIVAPNCNAAVNMFRQIADAAPSISRRTRRAYQQFKAGDYNGAITNYMAAAESGSEVGMVNAAWLLERHCPTQVADRKSCIKASVRYWSEAARLGDAEANLNLGDYYYYNKGGEDIVTGDESGNELVARAEKFWNYILYPETIWEQGRSVLFQATKKFLLMILKKKSVPEQPQKVCPVDGSGSDTCQLPSSEDEQNKNVVSDHLKTAALYYKRAASEFKSPRANFNLGFMHQWGVGLKQDFPLAKRHYDLAANSSPEAGTAVQLALWGMYWHENLLRLQVSWNENYDDGATASVDDSYEIKKYRIQLDGFFARVMSWESLLISFLFQLLLVLWRSCRRGGPDRV